MLITETFLYATISKDSPPLIIVELLRDVLKILKLDCCMLQEVKDGCYPMTKNLNAAFYGDDVQDLFIFCKGSLRDLIPPKAEIIPRINPVIRHRLSCSATRGLVRVVGVARVWGLVGEVGIARVWGLVGEGGIARVWRLVGGVGPAVERASAVVVAVGDAEDDGSRCGTLWTGTTVGRNSFWSFTAHVLFVVHCSCC